MGKFADTTIAKAVSELNVSYFLPDIQREYVWLSREKEHKIELLFDSVLREYPIGTFLFWKLKTSDIETDRSLKDSGKINFQLYKFISDYDVRRPHNEKIDIAQVNSNDVFIVLDGQQRLTSLYIGLKGSRTLKKPYYTKDNPLAYEEKKLYLNLRHTPEVDNPDDNYQFVFKSPKDKDLLTSDAGHFWFKVGDILNLKSLWDLNKYCIDHGLGENEMKIHSSLQSGICLKNFISFYCEEDKDLDKVLKIFIRVNSGGTKLSYSDLLMSLLTANFRNDIRSEMNELVEDMKEKGFETMGRDQILKTCLILTGAPHTFLLKNFNKMNIFKIEEEWDSIRSNIYDATKILSDFGYMNFLSSGYIISMIAYYLRLKGLDYSSVSKDDLSEIKRFTRNSQIKAFFSSHLDSTLSKIIPLMKESVYFKDFNKSLRDNRLLYISKDDIKDVLHLQYGADNYALFSALQTLYPTLDYKSHKFHIDHIFPKSRFTAANKNLPEEYRGAQNRLFNLQLLDGQENINKSAKDPEEWLKEEYPNDEERLSFMKSSYIPCTITLDWQHIADFEKARTELMEQKLLQVFAGDLAELEKEQLS